MPGPRLASAAGRPPAFVLIPFALVFLLASCARLPNAPGPAGGGPRATSAALSSSSLGVLVHLQSSVSGDDFAASYGSVVIESVPELELEWLRTPPDASDSSFARRLSSDPRVIYAEPNRPVECAEARQSTVAFSEGNRTWTDVTDQDAFTRVGVADAQGFSRGEGVLVAILDTGVDLDHPALAGALSLPGIEPGVVVDPGDDRPEALDTNGDGIVDGALGHGTHVAGIVHAIAPLASLLPVRVLDSDGVGDVFRVTRGLVEAVRRGAQVANLSLGVPEGSRALEAALDYARAAGLVVVAPVGNENVESADFPASATGVTAVAGTDALDHKAEFSSYGPRVNVAAPAVGILSTYWNGGYAVWSGTSMAAPFASGIAALLYAREGARAPAAASAVQTLIAAGAAPLGTVDPVYGSLLGAGRVNAASSLRALEAAAGGGTDSDPLLLAGSR